MLDRTGAQALANLSQVVLAQPALVARHPHLDQFVAPEVDVDLLEHGGAQSLVADHHHGVERMGERFELPTAGGIEFQGGRVQGAWMGGSF